MTDDMNDERFLGYVEMHAETERHLFSRHHVNRLHALAGVPLPAPSYGDFLGMGSDYVRPLIEKARVPLRAAARAADTKAPHGQLRAMLLQRSVRTDRTFTLKSGKLSNFFVDCKQTALTANGHHLAGCILLRALDEHFPNVETVAGVALGGCPLASAVSTLSAHQSEDWPHPYALNALYVREARKDHGTSRRIEGPIDDTRLHVVLLEDVVTTGGSSLAACDALTEEGCRVLGVIALVDREEGATEAFAAREIPLRAIFTQTELRA